MIHLKSVIHDTKTNSVEATWVDEISSASVVPAAQVPIKCHSYADVQMGLFRADVSALGGNIAEHEALIALVEAAIVLPTAAELLQQKSDLLAKMWEQIKASRDQHKGGGVLVNGKWFHTDTDSRIQQLGLKDTARDMLSAGASLTDLVPIDGELVPWKTMDGSYVQLSIQLVLDIVEAVKVLDKRVFKTAEAHRAAMEASTNPVEYDFSTGWPVGFQQ